MIIEFIQSYIWCPKNAPQGRAGHAKEETHAKGVGLWVLLRYLDYDIGPLLEADVILHASQIPDCPEAGRG